ncbi:MAG: sulfatase-like hydrolase/transferase [Gallionella sp.]
MSANIRSCLILLPFITLASFALTWLSSYQDFSVSDLKYILVLTIFIVVIQLIAILIASKLSRRIVLVNLVFAVFALLNVYFLHLSLIVEISRTGIFIQAILAIVGLFMLFTVKEIADKSKLGLIAILSVISVMLLFNASPMLKETYFTNEPDQKITSNLKFVPFKEKPNVYIVAFDALMPESLIKSHLDLEQTPYSSLLKKNFRPFKNMFADDEPTRASLSALLGFDKKHYLYKMGLNEKAGLFSGNSPSPLGELFKRNGYTFNTLFHNNYFGNSKGDYVDNYFSENPFTVCEFIDSKERNIVFFGYCSLQNMKYWKKDNKKKGGLEFLITSFEQQLSNDEPQFFLAYVYSPGHTKRDYRTYNQQDLAEFRQQYLERSKSTTNYLKRIIEFIDSSDEQSILVVIGDHGPYLSRTIEYSDNPKFYIQDRFGIYGGIYPKEKCAEYFNEADAMGYSTPVIVLDHLVRCLSGGELPFIKPQRITGPWSAPRDITYQGNIYE